MSPSKDILYGQKKSRLASTRSNRDENSSNQKKQNIDPDWYPKCKKCDLSESNFDKSKLLRANLKGADLWNSSFKKANLSGSIFDGSDLSYSDFSGAKLVDASLSDANLHATNLQRSDLTNADLTNADVDGANFEGVIGLDTVKGFSTVQGKCNNCGM